MRRVVSFIALLLVTFQCDASRVVPEKLEDMISSVKAIVVATVRKAEKVVGTNSVHYRYAINVTDVFAGDIAARRMTVNFWPQGSPHVSLSVPFSGIEESLKEGQRYVFLMRSVGEEGGLGVVLVRAEPEERLDSVLKAWREQKASTNGSTMEIRCRPEFEYQPRDIELSDRQGNRVGEEIWTWLILSDGKQRMRVFWESRSRPKGVALSKETEYSFTVHTKGDATNVVRIKDGEKVIYDKK